jgi:hypothetical protein
MMDNEPTAPLLPSLRLVYLVSWTFNSYLQFVEFHAHFEMVKWGKRKIGIS